MNADIRTDPRDVWDNPLASRYASSQMTRLWSDNHRYKLWRQSWLALAEAEAELGLPISQGQLAEMRAHLAPIDFAKAANYERRMRHDVFAHLHTFADACPSARPIIHLGATSAYVTDNVDLILMRESLDLVAARLAAVIERLAAKALVMAGKQADEPLAQLASAPQLDRLSTARSNDQKAGLHMTIDARITDLRVVRLGPDALEARAQILYRDQGLDRNNRVLSQEPPGTLRNTYVVSRGADGIWRLTDFRPGF